MNKFKTAMCIIALGVVSSNTYADMPTDMGGDGTVTFTGKLTANTCQVDTESKDKKVTLPTLSTQKLTTAGNYAGTTSFQLQVINCSPDVTEIGAHFEALGSTGKDPATGNLINSDASDTGAKNVQVRLYDADNTQLALGTASKTVAITAAPAGAPEGTGGTATLNYAGGYYATGKTTAGDVKAQVVYSLVYK
ncbi:fimbrial protein [Rouxiella sp. Mn2063]|uniref:fimbrial protein n=1 Tax=Rouxiella sp. Mn2063 TaxID=3395262 RepID=UPI003BE34578